MIITQSMTVTDPGSPVLQGSGTGVGFLVAATGVTISGFTIENFATGVEVGQGASLTLMVDTIQDLTNADGSGGGVLNAGTLTIKGGAISNNTANSGGGIYNSGGQVQITGAILSLNWQQSRAAASWSAAVA